MGIIRGAIASLEEAAQEEEFGGKAASLARSLKSGLPVPEGFAISAEAAAAVDAGHRPTVMALLDAYRSLGGLVAVRSSAVGEDSADLSFAGQHATILGVQGERALLAAVFAVFGSAFSEHASTYRREMAIDASSRDDVRIGIVVQRIIAPIAAGVLFTANPMTGEAERVIEAAWGLGEAVVASLVTPDHVRASPGGRILAYEIGHKPFSLHPLPGGGTERRDLDSAAATARCLTGDNVERLDELAAQCEALFGSPQDIEWALSDAGLFLLQSRPITSIANKAAQKVRSD